MIPIPQFRAELEFHFKEHGSEHRDWFAFGDSCHRRVPMQVSGVEGLNTVGMWANEPGTYRAGDKVLVDCVVIAPELFSSAIKPGVKFELWDCVFFATGTVLERNPAGWPNEA